MVCRSWKQCFFRGCSLSIKITVPRPKLLSNTFLKPLIIKDDGNWNLCCGWNADRRFCVTLLIPLAGFLQWSRWVMLWFHLHPLSGANICIQRLAWLGNCRSHPVQERGSYPVHFRCAVLNSSLVFSSQGRKKTSPCLFYNARGNHTTVTP